jgi:hypothetical protein
MVGVGSTHPFDSFDAHTKQMASSAFLTADAVVDYAATPCYCGYHHEMDHYFEQGDDNDSHGGNFDDLSAIEMNLTSVIDAPEFQPLDDLLKPIPMEDFMALDCGWAEREAEMNVLRNKALEDTWLRDMLGNGKKEKILEQFKHKVKTVTSRKHLWVSLDYFNSCNWTIKGEFTATDGTVYESVEDYVEKMGYSETVRGMVFMKDKKAWEYVEMEKYTLLTKSAARKRLAAAFDPLLFYVRMHTQCVEENEPTVWQHAVTLEYWPNGVPARLREE